MSYVSEKREHWDKQVGKTVSAQNHRGETATGCLLGVVSGVWGYGGDSVALVLDVKDTRCSEFWPAGLCAVVE